MKAYTYIHSFSYSDLKNVATNTYNEWVNSPNKNKYIVYFFFLLPHQKAYSETSGIITMFYVVRGLSPYTEYEFHVIGVNNIGR